MRDDILRDVAAEHGARGGEACEPAVVRDPKGRPIWCSQTACAIIEADPAWAGVLAYDDFGGHSMVARPLPGSRTPLATFRPRPLREDDITAALRWFNRHGFPDATRNTLSDAMHAVAGANVVSPVADYLGALRWDRHQRLGRWLTTYLGADDTPLSGAVGRAWMISAAARALDPGCKADCALVLEGPQGIGKSTALRVLASDAWFSDALRDMHGKDASQGLRGKWIIELPELAALRRSEVEAVKSFLSRAVERYRPPYGRFEVIEPRRCVFAGTTNRTDYLNDDTGSRRFWPVAVRALDLAALTRDRDQLWAEAVAAFRAGEPWWLDAAGAARAAVAAGERACDDPWTGDVLGAVATLDEVSSRDVLQRLEIPRERWTKADAQRVSGILTRNGWTRDRKFTGGPNRDLARYVRAAK